MLCSLTARQFRQCQHWCEWTMSPPPPHSAIKQNPHLLSFIFYHFLCTSLALSKHIVQLETKNIFPHRLEPLIFFNLYFGLESLGEGWEFTSLVYSFTWTAIYWPTWCDGPCMGRLQPFQAPKNMQSVSSSRLPLKGSTFLLIYHLPIFKSPCFHSY